MATFAGLYTEEIFDQSGGPARNTLVEVRPAGSAALAVLYTDRTKAVAAANPAATDALGNLSVYAEPGMYDFTGNGGTFRDAVDPDPADADASALLGGKVDKDPHVIHASATATAAELQVHLTALAGGGELRLPPRASYALAQPLAVPAGVTLSGAGSTSLLLPSGAAFPAVLVDAANDAKVRNLRVAMASGASVSGATAVAVRGGSTRVVVDGVVADGLFDAFRVEAPGATVTATLRNVAFVGCHARNSGQYGYRIDDVDGLEIERCTSTVSGLDGVKLRKLARNVTITGGYFTGATGGDGLDAYAGGESLVIQGAVFSGNTINGLTIKCDDLNKTDPAGFGLPRSVTLLGIRCDSNGGNGLGVHRNGSTDDATEPLVTRVTVDGGSYVGNSAHGVFVRARSVSLVGVQAARNRGNGIRVEPTAFDVSIIAPQVAGNGLRDTVTDGISVAGQRVQIFGGASVGTDPDGATSDADVAAGVKSQRFGLRLEPTATDAIVVGLTLKYNLTAPLSDSSASALIITGPTDDAAAALLTLPNNRKVMFRNSTGTPVNGMQLTSAGSLTFGENPAVASMNFLAQTGVNFFAKLYTNGELEVDGALNHDGATAGFYGVVPVARASLTYSRTGEHASTAALRVALAALGLVADNTVA